MYHSAISLPIHFSWSKLHIEQNTIVKLSLESSLNHFHLLFTKKKYFFTLVSCFRVGISDLGTQIQELHYTIKLFTPLLCSYYPNCCRRRRPAMDSHLLWHRARVGGLAVHLWLGILLLQEEVACRLRQRRGEIFHHPTATWSCTENHYHIQ